MPRILQPLLLLVAQATDRELARYVEFLQLENRILRSKLPKRVSVTEAERAKLVEVGRRLGPAVRELISIVSPRTFLRWVQGEAAGDRKVPRGQPRKPQEIQDLVLDMARSTDWGHRRIHGELLKLGIRRVSSSTVARILKRHGVDPGPKRGDGTWHDFVHQHLQTLWACDFFTATVWSLRGPVTFYILFFINVGTRRVHVSGVTSNPDAHWMAEQADALAAYFDQQGEHRPTHIIRDRDTKFTSQFCGKLEAQGIQFRTTSRRSPNMNAFAESWVRAVKQECLRKFLIFGQQHLRYLLREYLVHYHEQRPHRGLHNRPPRATGHVEELVRFEPRQIVRRERLGGVLKHYERVAA